MTERYGEVLSDAEKRGVADIVASFEEMVERAGRAVVALPVGIAHELYSSDRVLYGTYGVLVDAGIRRLASKEDDAQRRSVDAALYGASGQHVRTAALSLNGEGLPSYGDVFIVLEDSCIDYRSAVLEENSYTFCGRHGVGPGGKSETRPWGHLACWKSRAKLAVAKCAGAIRAHTTAHDFAQILLQSAGDRETDLFMEVHIYGGFSRDAIAAWSFPRAGSGTNEGVQRVEQALIRVLREAIGGPAGEPA